MKYILFLLLPITALSRTIPDTTINGQYTIDPTETIQFNHVYGTGKLIFMGLVTNSEYANIFGDSLTVTLTKASVNWFGASVTSKDNSKAIVMACNSAIDITIPIGNYMTKTILLYNKSGTQYIGKSINLHGYSNYWTDRSILTYTDSTGIALGLQMGKGTSITNLTIRGNFKAPIRDTTASLYGRSGLQGLVIDPLPTFGGSSGCTFRDLYITGFTECYAMGGVANNGDCLTFQDIRVGECRYGFVTGQAQEKGNRVQNLVCWSPCHTLIVIARKSAGQWTLDGGNAAGSVLHFCYIWESGWFGSRVSNFYAENLLDIGYIGSGTSTGDTLGTDPGFIMDNCTLHFRKPGGRRLLNGRGNVLLYRCNLQYYGTKLDIIYAGSAVFDKCLTSGKLVYR